MNFSILFFLYNISLNIVQHKKNYHFATGPLISENIYLLKGIHLYFKNIDFIVDKIEKLPWF